jgi:N utilization substance protein B
MGIRRDIRRCALQALYQFDAGRADTPEVVRASLDESAGEPATHEQGFDLAVLAWEHRGEADRAAAAIAPDWPTYRQPAIDRSIIRLAYYEMMHGGTPGKVAINEAVELAREFSTEKSHLFINGVLDKLYRRMREKSAEATERSSDEGMERLSDEGAEHLSDEGAEPP